MQMQYLAAPVLTDLILDTHKVDLHKFYDLAFHPLFSRSAEDTDGIAFVQSAWTVVMFASHGLHWPPFVREASALRAMAWLRIPYYFGLATTAVPHVLR